MTKAQRRDLQTVAGFLDIVKCYLQKDSTVIAHKMNITGTKDTTWRNAATGEQAISFTKFTGSELCYLLNAIERINGVINPTPVIVTESEIY